MLKHIKQLIVQQTALIKNRPRKDSPSKMFRQTIEAVPWERHFLQYRGRIPRSSQKSP